MTVMKFGGTSVAGPEAISRTIGIIASKIDKRPVVVVSAMSGITDQLYLITEKAAAGDSAAAKALLAGIRSRHLATAGALLEGDAGLLPRAVSSVNGICDRLDRFVEAVCALGELSDRSKATVVSTGEMLSSTVISYAMNARGIKTAWVDAREMMVTEGETMKGDPQTDLICELVPKVINSAFEANDAVITQGFIARSTAGHTTVLGRGGSDYTASLIGMALEAEAVEIWTDVDGVLTADPRKVRGARKLDIISFEEAAEMANLGAKVLHPLTIEPAVKSNIPIYVLNSMNPSGSGTLIVGDGRIEDGVKSVSFKENILVINIISAKMIDASGFLSKIFDVFSRNRISVDLISTTEASISVTCDSNTKNIDKVVAEISEFAEVFVDEGKSQISVIGQNLVNVNGLMERIFASLQSYKVYMISQGATYINISVVVDRPVLDDAINSIHLTLFQ